MPSFVVIEQVKLSHEHQNWRWAELEEAVKLANYPDIGGLLRNAHKYLEDKK